jgi:hypothetical protein
MLFAPGRLADHFVFRASLTARHRILAGLLDEVCCRLALSREI